MGDPRGFLKIKRRAMAYRPVAERLSDFYDVAVPKTEEKTKEQASRCMDCGTPFCNWGCPLGNIIPEWNDAIHKNNWVHAFTLLNATNNLPEITGRVCPAPCEYACVLGINDDPVTIRDNEHAIIERAFKDGLIKAAPPISRSGKKVAVIGSGPAGLSAAMQLNRQGHLVTVYEATDRAGGFLRYGIPDFKLEKNIIDRRVKMMQEEGITFKVKTRIGYDIAAEKLVAENDAVCIAAGARACRDLKIEGRELQGVYQAVDYLEQSNRRVAGDKIPNDKLIDAKDKSVLVIGGGDTGADCVGTANRQGAKNVIQVEILPMPSKKRPPDQPWPKYPHIFKTSTSHEEGVERKWSVTAKKFIGEKGKLAKTICMNTCLDTSSGKPVFKEVEGTDFELKTEMVVLAMGFTGPVKEGLVDQLGLKLDGRGNIERDADGKTSAEKVFAAGDAARGPSLIVWAINEGRRAAEGINRYLSANR